MHSSKRVMILAAIVVFVLGTLAHFVYDWSGQNSFIGLLTPVNESTWEHMKLLFFPMLIIGTAVWLYLRKDFPLGAGLLPQIRPQRETLPCGRWSRKYLPLKAEKGILREVRSVYWREEDEKRKNTSRGSREGGWPSRKPDGFAVWFISCSCSCGRYGPERFPW